MVTTEAVPLEGALTRGQAVAAQALLPFPAQAQTIPVGVASEAHKLY